MTREKILWVVHYDSLSEFVAKASAAGCTGVAVRTDNDVVAAIKAFHEKNMKVYGWRWPSAKIDSAMNEVKRVSSFYQQGLDGYFIDAEGEPGKSYDWNQNGLDSLADSFCTALKKAGGAKPLGLTSHFLATGIFPKIPWTTFFNKTDLYLPQAYWRVQAGVVKHGNPEENYDLALQAWSRSGADIRKIVPMAGELSHATGQEIDIYAKKAQKNEKASHFYTYEESVGADVWEAIKRA